MIWEGSNMGEYYIDGYRVKIYLRDGREILIERNKGSVDVISNYVTKLSIREAMYTQNKNPVGVVNSGTLNVSINSLDNSLSPDNKNSPYYGLMDSTAEIEVQFKNPDESYGEYISMGRVYVSTWVGSSESDNQGKVEINATDLIGILLKNKVPNIEIKNNVRVNELLDDINSKTVAELAPRFRYKFKYLNEIRHNTLNNNDINAEDLSTLFNIISQSTLINMYIDRASDVDSKSINVVDITQQGEASNISLSDQRDITYAALDKGALVGYSGVKVNYSLYNINPITKITSLNKQTLSPGINKFDNINLANPVYKINSITVDSNSEISPVIKSFKYNRREASIEVDNKSSSNIEAAITLSGQTLNETKLSVTKKGNSGSNEILEVTNNLILDADVNTYADDLLELINKRGETLIVRGMFNPNEITLNKIVNIECKSLNVSGAYRIVEIQWNLAQSLKCEVRLIR